MNRLFAVLKFFNLLDAQGVSLSLTNLALIVAVVKIASAHTQPMDCGALFLALLNYAHRRTIPNPNQGSATDV